MTPAAYSAHDGLGLARLVSDGEATATELLAVARARADAVGDRINAICRRMDAEADARVARSLQGPFAGVPFLLKDLHQHHAGVPTSAGCRALAEHPVERNATVVD